MQGSNGEQLKFQEHVRHGVSHLCLHDHAMLMSNMGGVSMPTSKPIPVGYAVNILCIQRSIILNYVTVTCLQ